MTHEQAPSCSTINSSGNTPLTETPEAEEICYLLKKVSSNRGRMTARQLQRSNGKRYPSAKAAESRLDLLVKADRAVWQPGPPRTLVLIGSAANHSNNQSHSSEPASDIATDKSSDNSPDAGFTPVSGELPANDAELSDNTFQLISKQDDLVAVHRALANADIVALTIQATGRNVTRDRIRLLGLSILQADGNPCTHLIDVEVVDPSPLWERLKNCRIIGHNLVVGLGFLARLGFTPGPRRDVMLMSQLLHAGKAVRHSLAEIAFREKLGIDLGTTNQMADCSGPLSPPMLESAARETAVLLPIHDTLSKKLKAEGLMEVLRLESGATPGLVWASVKGISFDPQPWRELADCTSCELDALEGEMNSLSPDNLNNLSGGWDWSNPRQVQEVFDILGISPTSTVDEDMAEVGHPLARMLCRHRELTRRAAIYDDDWLDHIDADGRIRPTWHQCSTETGQITCGNPNLPRLLRDGAYRECFVAPAGRVLVRGIFNQIDLRFLAKIAPDALMQTTYLRGDDLHKLTACAILGCSNPTEQEYELAAAMNFGLCYGQSWQELKSFAHAGYGINLSDNEARNYRSDFLKTFNGLADWHRRTASTVLRETRTLLGRRRLFEPIPAELPEQERNKRRWEQYRGTLASPVQGSVADGLKLAIGLLSERRDQCSGAFPVAFLDDGIVIEADADQAEEAGRWLRSAMMDAMAPLLAPFPVVVSR